MNDRQVKIYVACHKKESTLSKIPYDYYIPIHCGKAIYKPEEDKNDGILPAFGDDTGDNISTENLHYCELTAVYWIWKNDKCEPDDIVGLNHYRRYFADPIDNMKMLDKETIISYLQDYDFIVNGSDSECTYEPCEEEWSTYNSYKSCHIIQDLDNALISIKERFPQYYNVMEREIKHGSLMCLCNIFICKKKYFDEYCEFLFTIMKDVEAKINFNDGEHEGYNGRVFGFLGERLFRPWLVASGHSSKGMPCLDWEKYAGYIWT